GEIQRGGRSQSARADAEHLRRLQLLLRLDADLRHDQVPAVALDFFVGQLRQRLYGIARRSFSRGGRAACDRRDDADGVVGLHRGLLLLQVADVLVVDVDIDEAAQLAV